MKARWLMLGVLFFTRLSMAFQFQAVAALSPYLMETYSLGLADIGFLIGLYLMPGIVLALPGGALGQRFGDKRVVALGMVMMLIGALMMLFWQSYEGQVVGRLFAGIGGVTLNVLMSKMVTDWFVGREIATAMGIFVNSWPVGIAAALVCLPFLAEFVGLQGALICVTAFVAVGLLSLLVAYKAPEQAGQQAAAGGSTRLKGGELRAMIAVGGIWGLYNASLGMIFGFGAVMLVEWGWEGTSAASTTSLVLWIAALSVPLGGLLADRLGRPGLVMIGGLMIFGLFLILAAHSSSPLLLFILLGIACGIPAGPIMGMPSQVLAPQTRATGMGLFFTLFYLCVVFAPMVAGALADWSGRSSIAFEFGAVMLAATLPLYLYFKRQAARLAAEAVAT